ncbi:MAG TPA: aminoacyl-tRNA hydrolase [Phycisphaerales bacterium]|mgnify:CR=1 FL=1|nr:aminoacyl-tRNA hydrolase [Phycisphaerales bacterium]HMP37634.1 aminoacyl-tRNA hydrolase [Phycisphaerales bacterium]
MKLIVGLGNPGPEYDRTRHNVGFEVVDRLARRSAAAGATARNRFSGLLLEAAIAAPSGAAVRTLLLKPLTYMNRSGIALSEAVRFHKLDPARDLLVIVDDLALACGVIRLRERGSAGGHNGLADIERLLGTDEYARLRIGIDPPGAVPQKSYVLGLFRPDQRERIEPGLEEAVAAAECWATQGIVEAMNRFNRRNAGAPN